MPIVDRLTSVPDVAPGPGFAHAVTTSGKLAFVSGQVALDAGGQLVGPGDLAAQTAQALRNLHRILGALGADWPDVARFAWYVRDAGSVQVIRDVRDEFIGASLGEIEQATQVTQSGRGRRRQVEVACPGAADDHYVIAGARDRNVQESFCAGSG